jgi:hypothetical protein
MANPVGNAAGSAVPGLLVATAASSLSASSSNKGLAWLTLGQAVAATVVAAGMWAQAKDRPPTPPSAAAAAREEAEEEEELEGESKEAGESEGGQLLVAQSSSTTSSSRARAALARVRAEYSSILLGNPNFRLLICGFGLGLGILTPSSHF